MFAGESQHAGVAHHALVAHHDGVVHHALVAHHDGLAHHAAVVHCGLCAPPTVWLAVSK